jgi:heme oxygenase
MNNLRELTKEEHRRAERTAFMNRMLKKKLTPYQYYTYLKNQLLMYVTLEYYATEVGIFGEDIFGILRSAAILEDITIVESESEISLKTAPTLPAATAYVEYIHKIKEDKDKLLAHMYVRHMGDLSGGQMIKKLVPGPTNFYEFERDVDELKTLIRNNLHDGLEKEAKVCFSMVQKFLEELEDYFGGMDPADSTVKED